MELRYIHLLKIECRSRAILIILLCDEAQEGNVVVPLHSVVKVEIFLD